MCCELRIKPLQQPFWIDLPYVNIFKLIMPNILHQLYQGVIKHLISWLTSIHGAAEIDAQVCQFSPNHSIQIFHKGISVLTWVTSTEHQQIAVLLLGLISDSPTLLVIATHALLDFLYLAQYPVHTNSTLQNLQSTFDEFHNKAFIFIELGIHHHLNITKFHSLQHYMQSIKLFSTTDSFNTEAIECLHTEYAKDAYQGTNHKEEFHQMMKWLEWREKVIHHTNFIMWRSQCTTRTSQISIQPSSSCPDLTRSLQLKMALHPTRKLVLLKELISLLHYNAWFFLLALTCFIALFNNPTISHQQELDWCTYLSHPFLYSIGSSSTPTNYTVVILSTLSMRICWFIIMQVSSWDLHILILHLSMCGMLRHNWDTLMVHFPMTVILWWLRPIRKLYRFSCRAS